VADGYEAYRSKAEADRLGPEWVKAIFRLPGVEALEVRQHAIRVRKADGFEWAAILEPAARFLEGEEMLLWDEPDYALGFEEYLQAQEIPVIRVPMKPAGKPNVTVRGTDQGFQEAASEVSRRLEEWEPTPEPITGATYPCGEAWQPEDDATRLARLLQCEEMRTEYLWRNLDEMTRKRDFWQRGCACAYGVALALLLALVSVVWR